MRIIGKRFGFRRVKKTLRRTKCVDNFVSNRNHSGPCTIYKAMDEINTYRKGHITAVYDPLTRKDVLVEDDEIVTKQASLIEQKAVKKLERKRKLVSQHVPSE